jgi:hypothetical protein
MLGFIVECLACGGIRYAGDGPHAPRWHDGHLVDCVGVRVGPQVELDIIRATLSRDATTVLPAGI